jgi:GNAT superfamily N-acetyltransferase
MTHGPTPRGAPGEARDTAAGEVLVRPATARDVDVLAEHRALMFRDMGRLDDAAFAALVAATRAYFMEAMPRGEYVAWVAVAADAPARVVGGAGVHLRPQIPRPDPHDPARVIGGVQGLIVNVYTDRAWRRRGVGRRLVEAVIAYGRHVGLGGLVLHASDEGRPLYAQLGFVPSSEMRYDAPLTRGDRPR